MRWFWSLYGVVGKPPKVHTKRPCGDARGGARIRPTRCIAAGSAAWP